MELLNQAVNVIAFLLGAIGLICGFANISMFLGYPCQKGAIPKFFVPFLWFVPMIFPKFDDPNIQKKARIQAWLFIILSPVSAFILVTNN